MAKIRVSDLARHMNVATQDLMFKLRSIGVRVDGDDAAIDKDVIEAILYGKKLRQPREVILRDDEPEEGVAGPQPANRPSSLRPPRRAMIQRVESRIHNIDSMRPRPGSPATASGAPEAPPAAAARSAAAPPTATASPSAASPSATSAGAASPSATSAGATAAAASSSTAPSRGAAAPTRTPPAAERTPDRTAQRPGAPAGRREPAGRPPVRPGRPAPPTGRTAPPRPPLNADPRRTTRVRGADDRGRIPDITVSRPRPEPPPRPTVAASATPARPPARPTGARPVPGRVPARTPGRPPGRPALPSRQARGARPTPTALQEEPLRPTSDRGRRRTERKEQHKVSGTTVEFKGDRPEGTITLTEGMTVREFAEKLGVKVKDLMKILMQRGLMVNINHAIDAELAAEVAADLGVEVMEVTFEEEVQLRHESTLEEDVEKELRAPVVTVMGHVDHGKTTLLDAIRSANVAGGEAGGITQHIAAYRVDIGDGRQVVFLDTPGHEAFTMMRARGAKVTDIVVLVVAADDGVMPQTLEAIDHAKAARVPIVVAINKVDKPNANLDRVKKELADHDLLVEDWGGDTVAVPLSALKREGIDTLLEMIQITSELLELKAAPLLPASGIVIEARKEVGRGNVATILIQDGTLRQGDVFVAGAAWGRVRSMSNDHGERIQEAGPSTPVEVTGFDDLPDAGDALQVVSDEQEARTMAEYRRREQRKRDLAPQKGKMSLEQLFDKIEQEEIKELPVIIKADVQGSVEVLRDTLEKQSTEKVTVKVIHAAVGAVTTNDVLLASASEAIIVGFNVRPERNAASLADKENVEIRLHTVIYELVDELRKAMAGLLEPILQEAHRGTAEVREIFTVPRIGVIAGCHVTDGVIPRNAEIRLLRDNVVVYQGKISSLRRFKDDVSEVRSGFDCGIGLDRFQDLKPGDEIEAFVKEEVAAVL